MSSEATVLLSVQGTLLTFLAMAHDATSQVHREVSGRDRMPCTNPIPSCCGEANSL